MKMIQAIVRPEKEQDILDSLEKTGLYPYTRQGVAGRGRQRGLQVGPVRYEELQKVWIMIVVEDDAVERAIDTIKIAARSGQPGDGKIFVSNLFDVRMIRVPSAEPLQNH